MTWFQKVSTITINDYDDSGVPGSQPSDLTVVVQSNIFFQICNAVFEEFHEKFEDCFWCYISEFLWNLRDFYLNLFFYILGFLLLKS